MASTNIYPYGQEEVMPTGYPIYDGLDSNSAQKALSAKQGKRLKEMMSQPSQMPTLLICGTPTNIIYTIDDFMLAHDYVEGSTDNLKFSTDLGKTWITVENTYGKIVNAFMFADGTFMMATKKSEGCRIYWTRDFSTFTEVSIIDYDGSAYTIEPGKTRFYIIEAKTSHTYVDGVEHFLFWDYIISTTTKPRLWYAISDENGVTVRAAFAFGYSQIDGVTYSARHGHAFTYNPHDGYFYALTGDSVSECHVMRGRYVDNNGTHTWTWEHLATGGGYKLVSVAFDEGNMYAVTDYTETSLREKKGIVSIPTNMITETVTEDGIVMPARMRYWFHATTSFMAQGSANANNPAAMSGFIADNNGWRVAGTDYLGGSKLLIAKDSHNFVWVATDNGLRLGGFVGPNNKGDVFVKAYPVGYSFSGEDWLSISHKTMYNLTEIMRRSGATDFFEGWRGTLY